MNPFSTLTDLADGLRTRQFSSVELARFYLDRGRRLYEQENDREALGELRRDDRRRGHLRAPGIHGVRLERRFDQSPGRVAGRQRAPGKHAGGLQK